MLKAPLNRRGLSLIEVLVAFFILAVGIVGVISLFPIGVQQVRQAVQDTRSTIMAINAESTLEMHDWPNDPYLLSPPSTGLNSPLSMDPNNPPPLPVDLPAPTAGNSVYVRMLNAAGGPGANFASSGVGFPIYVDPVLANATEFEYDGTTDPMTGAKSNGSVFYKRVAISGDLDLSPAGPRISSFDALTVSPREAAASYQDLPIYTLSDVQLTQENATISGNTRPIERRQAFLRHWFYSDADLHWDMQNNVMPRNPNRQLPSAQGVEAWEYFQSTLPPTPSGARNAMQARATAERDSLYSWAFVVTGRQIIPITGGNLVPAPNWRSNVRILVFQRRNLSDPYRLMLGCMFNGSNVATLCWPTNPPPPAPPLGKELTRPTIRRGTWLMEYTNTGGQHTADPPGNIRRRHKVTFHRVSAFDDPVLSGTNWLQSVTLEKSIADSDFPKHVLGNLRPLPDQFVGSPNPYFGTAQAPAPTIADNTILWVPIIVWDGLIEAFEVKD